MPEVPHSQCDAQFSAWVVAYEGEDSNPNPLDGLPCMCLHREMNAIVQRGYGGPDVLSLQEIPTPVPKENEVLVRVRAAALNVLDWRKMRADPFVARIVEGFRTPRQPVLGVDAAGVVEKVGRDVTHLTAGDEVFGLGRGSLAEYTVGKAFAPKPSNLTFQEAAALPVAGSTSLQAVRDVGRVQEGQHVLVNGAGGGVGHLLVQILKAHGAQVTATTRTEGTDLIRSLGADHVIDHTKDNFRARGERYHSIFEVGGELTCASCRDSLTPGGRLVYVGAGSGFGGPIGRFLGASCSEKVLRRPVTAFVSEASISDLQALKEMAEARSIKPVIHRSYGLAGVPEAVRFLEAGGVRGKIVITL